MNTPLDPIPKAAIFSTVQRMQDFSNWSVTYSYIDRVVFVGQVGTIL